MAKTLAQIQAKHKQGYQDEDDKTVTSHTFIKEFTFFEDIERLYSNDFPDGKVIDSFHVALYCRFLSYQANDSNCYESHATLARKHKTSSSTVKRRIEDLRKLGLVITDEHPDPNISSLLYTALPLTDAHVIPPDQLPAAPIIVSNLVPEPATAEETQDDATEKSEPLGLPETITDEMKIDAMCDLLSKPESLRQQNRGDTFINYARRVLHRKSMKLPSRFEEELEMRFEHRYPHFYGRFGTPF
ncbi:helix-turn-helix domain-containing protein [Enterobacter hormaechei]|uniref:helix-turn-helix domain-containing protein n=1 Tax=Enterobacter hormaechei TaxID=158836 RepID=UPI001D0C6250|nr:helix-turn-helix domain-containing protein [Enterobacter hormaechei]MCC2016518.1 helix-turn-helix domain-containing protein [Enterobacter hormaechei]MDV5643049.1 helix-turn-helix domain-containing protein [Enterobacter hormaechei]